MVQLRTSVYSTFNLVQNIIVYIIVMHILYQICFVCGQEEDQIYMLGTNLHSNCHWDLRGFWPADTTVFKGPWESAQTGYRWRKLLYLPYSVTVCVSAERKRSIGARNNWTLTPFFTFFVLFCLFVFCIIYDIILYCIIKKKASRLSREVCTVRVLLGLGNLFTLQNMAWGFLHFRFWLYTNVDTLRLMTITS